MNVLKRAGIRSSLETICRQYADLCAASGGAGLLTDIVRKNVSGGPAKHTAIQLGRLKDLFISTMESEGRSARDVQVLKSYCGTFVREIGPDTMTDQITRETIQKFLNDRKVGPRGKLNFARAIRVMSVFGKRQRCLPEDWAEIDHLTLPLVKDGTVLTYSPDDLKRLLAAAPDTFIPCLALAAFAGMRSAEIERIGWDNIRLVTKSDTGRVINLEAGIAKTNSRRTITIHETLAKWLDPHIRPINRSGLAPTASVTGSSSKSPRTLASSGSRTRCGILAFLRALPSTKTCPGLPMSREIPRRLSSSIICN